MSDFDYNLNNSFDNYQNELYQNNIKNNKYNFNTMTIPNRQKSPVNYDIGVDNYVFHEIQKAKYQGVFDPTSLGNKNIFIDSSRKFIKNSDSNNQQKIRKSIRYNKGGDGKNLLIIKSEIKYPLDFKYNTNTIDMNYYSRNNKDILNYNHYYIESKNNNNYRNIFARSNDNKRNYLSPVNYVKKISNYDTNNLYQTRTINLEKLNKDYDKRFKEPKRTLYEKYSTNTISFNDINKKFSPTFAPSRNQNAIKQNNMKNLNITYSKNINNRMNDENDFTNNTLNYENEYYIDNFNHYDNDDKNNRENLEDLEKIKKYRKKLLTLFFWHINNFYKIHFKVLFKDIIQLLKRNIYSNEHHFENKTIKNIALLKQEIKNNSYYYGHNNQYKNLLNGVKIISNRTKEINNIENTEEIDTPREIINEINKNNIDSEERQIKNKKIWNKKIISDNENKINWKKLENKKYTKKKIPQGIYGKKIIPKKINYTKNIISTQERNYTHNFYINEKNEKTPIIQKKLKIPKSTNQRNLLTSGKKIINEYIKLNKNELENKSDNNNNSSFENEEKEKEKNNNYEIDKNMNYTIDKQKDKNEENNDIEEDNGKDLENSSNKNLQNALVMITKVIENKEKNDKKNKLEFLIKIINNKINKVETNIKELIKKCFNKLKQNETNEKTKKEKIYKRKIKYPKDLVKNTKLKRNKKLKKYLFLSDLEDNDEKLNKNFEKNANRSEDEDKLRNKRKKDKFRIIIKQIRINKNEINYIQYNNNQQIKFNTPTRSNKKNLTEISNKTPTHIIKKSLLIVFDKTQKNNINKNNEITNTNQIKLEEKEVKSPLDILINENDNNKINDKEIEDIKSKDDEDLKINDLEINEYFDEEKENKKKEKFSIESFAKYRRSKVKFNQDENDNDNEEDITLTEKYQDCENFIYFLRNQLIYCFLTNKNSNDSFLD